MSQQRQYRNLVLGKDSDEGVQYRLQSVPKLMRKSGDGRTAKVLVVPRRKVGHDELLHKLCERSLVDAPIVRYVLDKLTDVILTELQAGNTISLDNRFLFGVSIPGRVSPQKPVDVKRMKLVPTMRFSPPFHRALNWNAKKQYLSNYQPTEVEVTKLEWFRDDPILYAEGHFHNLKSLRLTLLAGGQEIPCTFRLSTPSASTRDIGKRLTVSAQKLPIPEGPRSVRFTYKDSTGETITFTVEALHIDR